MNIEINEAQELPTQIQTLAKHAAQEGFDFVHRLIEEWESGKNRFNQPGEFLLFVYDGDQLVACGGLNQQWNEQDIESLYDETNVFSISYIKKESLLRAYAKTL